MEQEKEIRFRKYRIRIYRDSNSIIWEKVVPYNTAKSWRIREKCLVCEKTIQPHINVYDREEYWINNKYCSTECFTSSIDGVHSDYIQCPQCKEYFYTTNPHREYCSLKCNREQNGTLKRNCSYCNKEILWFSNCEKQICFCNDDCDYKYRMEHNKKYQREYTQKQRDNNPMHKLRSNTSSLIYQTLKNINSVGIKHKFPFNIDELKFHLEKTMPINTDWNDYGNKLHLAHLIPISWFSNEDEFWNIGWNINNLALMINNKNLEQNNRYGIVDGEIYDTREEAIKKFKEIYMQGGD